MDIPNDIALRPRFTIESDRAPEVLLLAFEDRSTHTKDIVISRVDDHVFLRIPKREQHFWSPQLHLEIYKIDKQPTVIRGLFGPSPTVWTLFMFLHFLVATLFIGAGIWLYTSVTLNRSLVLPIVSMASLIVLWFVLYIAGRLGKRAGKTEMRALHFFMNTVLKTTS